MEIQTYGNNLEITPALQNYVQEKVGKVGKHFDQHCQIRVTLRLDKPQHHADADVTLAGKALHAKADGQSMYAAIDILADKLDQLVIKHKEKKHLHAPVPAPLGDNVG